MSAVEFELSGNDVQRPPRPRTVEDIGIPYEVVLDIALKTLYFRGGMRGRELADHLRLPFALVQPAIKLLTGTGHIASGGMQGHAARDDENVSAAVHWMLTQPGQERVREIMELNQYAGPVPVPVEDYAAFARMQAPDLEVAEEDLRGVLSHLVLNDEVYEALGPALNARHTMFLYGPPGNGKTSIADACSDLLGAPIFVPAALYASGEIIRFLDPTYHTPADVRGLGPYDERWVCVRRPEVKVGGELGPNTLELSFDPRAGFYEASAQLKANGGIFLVDDFGRQTRMSSVELLNRLIVPLEKGVDFINMARVGTTIAVPFTTTLILSTNLVPEELMDEALLRRVRFKVLVPGPSEAEYREIWRRLCASAGIAYRDDVISELIQHHYRQSGVPFRGVHPRDLLSHVTSAARYRRRPAELSPELVAAACRAYFVRHARDW